MKDFIKKHYLLVTNIVCLTLVSMAFFVEGIAALGFVIVLLVFILVGTDEFLILSAIVIFLLVMNNLAYSAIKKDKLAGIIPAVLGGTIGAFAAVRTENPDYRAKKVINVFFSILMWACVWIALSTLLYFMRYYDFSLAWK
ncbi:MAG: hypothetical protein IJ035_10965 [Oscillospiraceae bacterium]|nr:hypothetical protein [Oscillospiraceae bacterium]